MPAEVIVVGECMLELAARAPSPADGWQLGCAGDTFNTALYLARLQVTVAYLTALGADPFSRDMLAAWAREGIDTSLVLTHTSRLPGLYVIRNESGGERQFYYWRERSAARQLFALPGINAALARARRAAWFYLSGITLSIFRPPQQAQLIETAAAVRAAGGQVVFDPNYRPALWPTPGQARDVFSALAPHVSLALPTQADEAVLFGDADAAQTAARWRASGAGEVVVKCGAEGCLVATSTQTARIAAAAVIAVDTTGAGDAFNAAYLAGRIAGLSPTTAARGANRLAGEVIQHRGAILTPERMAILQTLWT